MPRPSKHGFLLSKLSNALTCSSLYRVEATSYPRHDEDADPDKMRLALLVNNKAL